MKLSAAAPAGVTVLKHPGGQLRLMPWQASTQVAYMASISDQRSVPREYIEQGVELLRGQGFLSVVTGAVASHHEPSFFDAGFTEKERLILLSLRLDGVTGGQFRPPIKTGASVGRPTRVRGRHLDDVLQVDSRCFVPFWRLDTGGINEALAATVRTRFRFYRHHEVLASYAISGFTGQNGFIQRLAVDPDAQNNGLGGGLMRDAMSWMYRRGVRNVYVNTQTANYDAIALYRRLGFRRSIDHLTVLERDLTVAGREQWP